MLAHPTSPANLGRAGLATAERKTIRITDAGRKAIEGLAEGGGLAAPTHGR